MGVECVSKGASSHSTLWVGSRVRKEIRVLGPKHFSLTQKNTRGVF
jgi:hypothetical protein